MAGLVKIISILPKQKPQVKVDVDPDEDVVKCSICSKGFVSSAALLNHVRMEHYSAYITGDPGNWTAPVIKVEHLEEENQVEQEQEQSQHNEEIIIEEDIKPEKKILSAMRPTPLSSLVSSDISYIIMPNEFTEEVKSPPRKKKKKTLKLEMGQTFDIFKNSSYLVEEENDDDETASEEDDYKLENHNKINISKMGRPSSKKEKVTVSSMGPFECLEPSEGTADGLCHQIFLSCCEYSAHFRDEHTRRRKCLYCQVCEKPLVQGLDQSDIERIFTCMVCGVGFLINKELKDHINKEHIKLKPFQCTLCPKRFTQQGGLQQHMRMHSGIRPFSCTYCTKTFTQKSGLEQHLRIHTKEKPYRCVVCHKSFIQPTHLKQHMRTHTNLAPFQCGICQKRFKQGSQLTCHLRVHGVTNMTEEQKQKYVKLLAASGEASETIEIEVDQSEADLIEQVEAERSITLHDDNGIELIESEAVVIEPYVADEAIQVEQVNDECYVIDEDESQTWTTQDDSS